LVKKHYKKDVSEARVINKKSRFKKGSKGISAKRGHKKIILTLTDKQIIPGFEIAKESKEEKGKGEK
jgi:hypothetical protein